MLSFHRSLKKQIQYMHLGLQELLLLLPLLLLLLLII
jgi:hypothetical protein